MMNNKLPVQISFRRRTYDFLELGGFGGRAAASFEIVMVVMIMANVIAVALETVPSLWRRYEYWFELFDVFSVSIFSIEYCARVWASAEREIEPGEGSFRRRLRYIFSPLALIDLIAILPFYLAALFSVDLRALRIFRLLRLLKLVRYSPALSSLGHVIYAERRALFAAFIVMLGLEISAATVMYMVERTAQPDAFGSIPDALWWALATLTTVGYGDVVPVTGAGKFVAGIVMVMGLAFYAIPIGIVASGFTDEVHRREFAVPVGLLSGFPVFSNLPQETLREIANRVRSLSLLPGTVLSHPRDRDNGVYFILSGEISGFHQHRPLPLRAGDFLGEFGILNEGDKQPATVVHSRTKVMWLESADLHTILMMHPELIDSLNGYTQLRLNDFVQEGRVTDEDSRKMSDPINVYS
ncbi:MAG: cyclic nucleotide-gated ion channel [Kordiimonas sp.]